MLFLNEDHWRVLRQPKENKKRHNIMPLPTSAIFKRRLLISFCSYEVRRPWKKMFRWPIYMPIVAAMIKRWEKQPTANHRLPLKDYEFGNEMEARNACCARQSRVCSCGTQLYSSVVAELKWGASQYPFLPNSWCWGGRLISSPLKHCWVYLLQNC